MSRSLYTCPEVYMHKTKEQLNIQGILDGAAFCTYATVISASLIIHR